MLSFNSSSGKPTRTPLRVSKVQISSWCLCLAVVLISESAGQHYNIPPDPENPEIDCFTHMTAWLKHLECLLQRPLEDDDFIFPAIASTGKLKFGEPTSRTGFENLLDSVIEASGVMRGRNGKFTTHCFRRGGAQYRFMWARHKWSLKAVKWWGGWSSSDYVCNKYSLIADDDGRSYLPGRDHNAISSR